MGHSGIGSPGGDCEANNLESSTLGCAVSLICRGCGQGDKAADEGFKAGFVD